MLIDDQSRYITHENNDEERKVAVGELGECLKSAMADCYVNNTLTKEAYISNIQKYLGGAAHQITFEPSMEVKLVDQYGRPWSEVGSNNGGILTTNALNMGWNLPIPFNTNVLLKSGTTTVVEEQLSESERQEKYSDIVEYSKTAEDLSDFKNYVENQGSWLTQEEKEALYDWWNEVHPETEWWEYLLGLLPIFWFGCAKEEPPAPELKSITTETPTEVSTEPPTESPTEPQGRITSQMMKDFGWPLSDEELNKLNDILEKYGITDMRSIRLFMAICGHESKKGTSKTENGSENYFRSKGYTSDTRGAGYIQVTGNEQLDFYKYIKKSAPKNRTQDIADNYAWEASAWEWAVQAKGDDVVMNNYVKEHGDGENIFLVTQYFINSYLRKDDYPYFDSDLSYIRKGGKFSYDFKEKVIDAKGEMHIGVLKVNGRTYRLPKNYADRLDNYRNAKDVFK